MGEYLGYSVLALLISALLATIYFAVSFWQGRQGGEYGVNDRTTTLSGFSFDPAQLPTDWLVNANQTDYLSLSDGQAGGCSVDVMRSDGIEVAPADARRYIDSELERSLALMAESGYTINRQPAGSVIGINTGESGGNDDFVMWPSYEFTGRWLDGDIANFNQINSLMLGDGYLLQVGLACRHDNFGPSLKVLNQVRFY